MNILYKTVGAKAETGGAPCLIGWRLELVLFIGSQNFRSNWNQDSTRTVILSKFRLNPRRSWFILFVKYIDYVHRQNRAEWLSDESCSLRWDYLCSTVVVHTMLIFHKSGETSLFMQQLEMCRTTEIIRGSMRLLNLIVIKSMPVALYWIDVCDLGFRCWFNP